MGNFLVELIVLGILVVSGLIIYILYGDRIKKKLGINKIETIDEEYIIDYNVYKMTKSDFVFYVGGGAAGCFMIGMIFYKSLILSSVLAFLFFLVTLKWPTIITNSLRDKRQRELGKQFKDALQAIAAEISSGRSFLNIILDGAITDSLKILYGDKKKKGYIIQEFEFIAKEMRNQVPERVVLRDFANRSGVEDIQNFVDVFLIGRDESGQINEIIQRTSNMIIEKMDINEEIETLISQKKNEQKIMTILPIGMIMFISLVAPDYMAPMYNTIFPGRVVMSSALGLIIFAYYLSKKITDIEV